MRKVAVLAVLVTFLAVGGWLVLGGETPRSGNDARASESRAQVVELDRDRPAVAAAVEPKSSASKPPSSARSKAEREAMRRRILEAMQTRDDGAAHEGGGTKEGEEGAAGKAGEPERQPPALKKRPDDEAPTPGNLIDRTGNHGHMVKVMNEDLMPLVDECYALARETQPELTGLLVLNVEMIGDEDIGGVVESVGLGQENEILDPALVECVQESLLSVTLPPPPEGGKEEIQLHVRLEPEG